ncbi:MAG: hypothetical protein J0I34_13565 [Pseudonocardia sp.]|uniref:hypothetical protein n=1 Tax=unclassified Pseudonocardia TaxID=2619320 RepID=UPI00086C9B20|nr:MULTISPECIES: hypothetical protein [unclassified Pseudonocardia]MBN9109798.1 hypothetical protein [Pseudonocardia sp.]ODU26771.1 MAG: hypothetical protein ABS80_06300 [Pseudonocardia sp. SCN 72-51]ODV09201.1 MAG: hypothetical protein ABT15_00925 [Pseudonocardia sp. SCN 73-27]
MLATVVNPTVPTSDGTDGVDLLGGALLPAGSLPTIAVAKRLLLAIPDRAHAVACTGLLVLTLVAVLVV